MKFLPKTLLIHAGKLCSANQIGDELVFAIKSDGRMIKRKADLNAQRIYGTRIIGFCDYCVPTAYGDLTVFGTEVILDEGN